MLIEVPAAVQPRQSVPPPLPFRLLARIIDTGSGRSTFVFTRDGSVLLARVGDELDGAYRLDAFEHGKLIFQYKPMNIRQTLPLAPTP
ncbi:hypothetical protein [Pseudothauera rhizosphaerae]|uniref:Uncharacterized protein n=1 Tax=Pseudothauera rhizosphaerae TaxID=2565932 RepID=A0A4S4AT80_9RHOO|nr:hypothetical protein [Pseudothauera rhizosphaerae]THF61769.1 hypothetical protein E6O51_10010 [Pseudothauera rhizosphaerae]